MKNTVKLCYHVRLFATSNDSSFERAVYEMTLPAGNACMALAKVLHSLPDNLRFHTIEVSPGI